MIRHRSFVSQALCSLGVFGLLVGFVMAPPVHAATPFPGENGMIAFSRTGGAGAVWTMSSTGMEQKPLVRGGHSPVWSPDGSRMVFVKTDGERSRLQIVNADGSGRRDVTRSQSFYDGSPAWSADGLRIAFVREKKTSPAGNKTSAVFTVRPDGRDTRRVSGWARDRGFRAPSWSPDGSRLVYEQYGEAPDANLLLIRDFATGQTRKLTAISDAVSSSRASWSPNGKKILYQDSDNQVYTIWPDGSHRTVISDGESYGASWSPDGTQIAFLESADDDHISISEADGTVRWVPIDKGPYQEIHPPTWSPDGSTLIFVMSFTSDSGLVSDMFSLDLTDGGSSPVKLIGGAFVGEPSWQAR